MIYTINLFKDEDLHKIKNGFDRAVFEEGKMTDVVRGKRDLNPSVKNNLEMKADQYYETCLDILIKNIEKSGEFYDICCPKAFGSVLFLDYREGMYYHKHNDYYMMKNLRTDYSCTVFLSDPSEYEGGELVIDIGNKEIFYKLNPGEAVLYPTGLKHRVNLVSSGSRKVVVFWIQSLLKDSRIRSIYADICMMQRKYKETLNADMHLTNDLNAIKYNVMRNFFDP